MGIEEEKKKIRDLQKSVKQKEKKLQAKSFEEVGKLSYKTNIYSLDQKVLIGAFLEIYEKAKNETIKNQWINDAEKWLSDKNSREKTPLSLAFTEPPSEDLKQEIKNLKFKWNSFRGEYYGYACKKSLQELLSKYQTPFTLDVIS